MHGNSTEKVIRAQDQIQEPSDSSTTCYTTMTPRKSVWTKHINDKLQAKAQECNNCVFWTEIDEEYPIRTSICCQIIIRMLLTFPSNFVVQHHYTCLRDVLCLITLFESKHIPIHALINGLHTIYVSNCRSEIDYITGSGSEIIKHMMWFYA